jgi:MscS family membrane protein
MEPPGIVSYVGGIKVILARSHRRAWNCLAIILLLSCLLPLPCVWAQLPKAAASKSKSDQPPGPQDSLRRDTPRGTVFGFLTAAYGDDYETAAQYMNTRQKGNEAEQLAKQLFYVLDRRLPAKLNDLSNDPNGSLSDPLDSRRELVGTVASEDGKIDIYVERVDRPNAPIWLFSRQTLVHIPDLYDEINAVAVENVLPEFLLRKFLGFTVFGWLFYPIGLPVLYLLLGLISRLLGKLAGSVLRHWAKRPDQPDPVIIPPPIRLLIVAGSIYAALEMVNVSLLARQVGSISEAILLTVALVWLAILLNGKFETFLKTRLARQGRLTSTVVLRPARRIMDLLIVVAGLMFGLSHFGINPTAALAGLGVGGIAVALAAQKTLENVIGGASLIMDEAVRLGDFLKVGNVEGTVEEIGLRSTRVRTMNRTLVTIPNSQMANLMLENYSARDSFWLRHILGLGYDTSSSSLNSVIEEVRNLLDRDPRVLPNSPRVRFLAFSESSLNLEVFAYVIASDMSQFLEIQESLLFAIREVITSNGVEIAFPVRTIHLKDQTDPDGIRARSLVDVVPGRQ